MSAINGDKARFNRQRRQKSHVDSETENWHNGWHRVAKPKAQPGPQIQRRIRQKGSSRSKPDEGHVTNEISDWGTHGYSCPGIRTTARSHH